MVSEIWMALLVVLWGVVLVMGFLLAGALREVGLLHLRLGADPGPLITDAGLPRGTAAPNFLARFADSRDIFDSSKGGKTRLLMFLTSTCVACRQVIPHLNEFAITHPELEVLAICSGVEEACVKLARASHLRVPLLLDESSEISSLFQVMYTPFAYLLSPGGEVVLRGVANDWRQLEGLLKEEGTLETGHFWEEIAPEIEGGAPSAVAGKAVK